MLDFNFAIRSPNEAAPLKNPIFCGCISSYLIVVIFITVFSHYYGFRSWGIIGFVSYLVIIYIVVLVGDGLVSNCLGQNIVNIKRVLDYSDSTIYLITLINLLLSQSIGYIIMVHVIQDVSFFTPYLLWDYVVIQNNYVIFFLQLLINLAGTEVLFFWSHRLLHTHPKLTHFHILHHCCTKSSFSTNVLFHPIDLLIEFGGPGLFLLGMHYTIWKKNDALLLVTYLIFQVWYAVDHDETLQLYHVKHHTYTDSLYSIYINIKGDPKKNILKEQILSMKKKASKSL